MYSYLWTIYQPLFHSSQTTPGAPDHMRSARGPSCGISAKRSNSRISELTPSGGCVNLLFCCQNPKNRGYGYIQIICKSSVFGWSKKKTPNLWVNRWIYLIYSYQAGGFPQHQQLPTWSKWCKEGDNPPWTARMLPPICAGGEMIQGCPATFQKMPVLGVWGSRFIGCPFYPFWHGSVTRLTGWIWIWWEWFSPSAAFFWMQHTKDAPKAKNNGGHVSSPSDEDGLAVRWLFEIPDVTEFPVGHKKNRKERCECSPLQKNIWQQ